jgi:hypothetical protein
MTEASQTRPCRDSLTRHRQSARGRIRPDNRHGRPVPRQELAHDTPNSRSGSPGPTPPTHLHGVGHDRAQPQEYADLRTSRPRQMQDLSVHHRHRERVGIVGIVCRAGRAARKCAHGRFPSLGAVLLWAASNGRDGSPPRAKQGNPSAASCPQPEQRRSGGLRESLGSGTWPGVRIGSGAARWGQGLR